MYIRTNLKLSVIAFLAIFPLLSGCANLRPYKMDIHQGNIIDTDKVKHLELGMTQSQVQSLLGTPLLQDIFNEARWDYLYYSKPAYEQAETAQLVVYFTEGRVSKIDQHSVATHPLPKTA